MDVIHTLFRYLKNHDYNKFQELLADHEEIDINYRDQNGNYLIQYAILFNKKDLVSLLISRGARLDVTDRDGRSIVYIAVKYNYLDILELLLHFNKINIGVLLVDIKDKLGNIPLHYAITSKNMEACELLLENGSDPNIRDNRGYGALHLSIYSKVSEIALRLIKTTSHLDLRTKNGETALHLACNFQLLEVAKALLEKGADPNLREYENELTPLNYSLSSGNLELIRLLLHHQADPELQDVYGNSALHYMIIEDNFEVTTSIMHLKNLTPQMFLNQNLDGHTPLHLIFQRDSRYQKKYLEMLLPWSEVNLQDNLGHTGLHLMIIHQMWEEMIPILEKKKLDIFIPNLEGRRPIDLLPLAQQQKFLQMVVRSYQHLLTQMTPEDLKKMEPWQKLCGAHHGRATLTPEEKKILKGSSEGKADRTQQCAQLIMEKLQQQISSGKCQALSYPKAPTPDLKIPFGQPICHCTFSGIALDILVGLLHLTQQHSNLGIPLTKDFQSNPRLRRRYQELGFRLQERTNFMNLEIVWIHGKMYYPTYFETEFAKLLKDSRIRFIGIPLGVQISVGSHANFLLFDKKKRELERFEPNGSQPPYQFRYNSLVMDEILESKFMGLIGEMKYIPPKDYLPKIGFQYLDTYDRKNRKLGDPGGFCAIWTVWYVALRVSHPDLTRTEVVRKVMKFVRRKNLSFREIIRNYTRHIIELRDEILKKAGTEINAWINETLTSEQHGKVIQLLQQKINQKQIGRLLSRVSPTTAVELQPLLDATW